ncbi:MAG: sigma-54-dependent Fis family transcriptional regulator [Nitrospirae bacterium]|nr:sigma-54-dependent Fis family transcriptional regulator [Nitrospirota bacterium]
MDKVLVVDDEIDIRRALEFVLVREGYAVETASNGAEAVNKLKDEHIDLVITDLRMEGMDGFGVLEKSQEIASSTPVIIMTAYGSIESAVEAMKKGAVDYIIKPFMHEELKLTIKRVLEHSKLSLENQSLRQQLSQCFGSKEIIGTSEPMSGVFHTVEKVAPTRANILITGESGTGKGLLAELIHENSPRRGKPFISINCAAIPETLLESEIFGYKKGAFTGATKDKTGLMIMAHEGTLFLDEIGDMPLPLQSKLLKVIETGEVLPLGDTRMKVVDIRIISAVNKDIETCIKNKEFREDLYYRLNVLEIKMPPLKERREDIPILVNHFLREFSGYAEGKVKGIDQAAINALISYEWPGNVRELRNVIERAVILSDGDKITASDFPQHVMVKKELNIDNSSAGPLKSLVYEYEKGIISDAMKKYDGNKEMTGKALGIDLATLYRKINKYGINE